MKITIVLPFLPPSLNRVAGRGPYNYRPKKPIDRSTVTIRYYFPDRRRPHSIAWCVREAEKRGMSYGRFVGLGLDKEGTA